MLTGKQKISTLIEQINDKRHVTPKGQPILIHPFGDLGGNYPEEELLNLLYKFQNDDEILKIARLPTTNDFGIVNYADRYYGVDLTSKFDKYYDNFNIKPVAKIESKPKLNRKSLEKVWNVLQEIETKRGITSSTDEITIPQVYWSKVKDQREAFDYAEERLVILRKLETEEQAIENLRWIDAEKGLAYMRAGQNYFEVYDWYEEEYKKASATYQKGSKPQQTSNEPVGSLELEIVYTSAHEVILNKRFLLSKPTLNGENDLVMSYLYKNSNRPIGIDELEEKGRIKPTKSLGKIVENLGFTKDLARAFFVVSADSIYFKNPVTKVMLDELELRFIKIKAK